MQETMKQRGSASRRVAGAVLVMGLLFAAGFGLERMSCPLVGNWERDDEARYPDGSMRPITLRYEFRATPFQTSGTGLLWANKKPAPLRWQIVGSDRMVVNFANQETVAYFTLDGSHRLLTLQGPGVIGGVYTWRP